MVNLAKSSVMYREVAGDIDTIVSGKGCYLFTKSGRALFDFSGGPCVTSLGHSNAHLLSAINSQLSKVPYVYSGFWANEAAEELGDLLREDFDSSWPGWFGKVAFVCSGNEAVDFACRLAVQYWIERGQPRHLFGVRSYSFHGTNLFTSAITDDYGRYSQMAPWYEPVRRDYVLRLPGYAGCWQTGENIRDYENLLLRDTRDKLVHSFSSGRPVAAVVLEPVGGPPVGAVAPSDYYLSELQRLCTECGTLLIFDEILSGSGRCGALTAAQMYDVRPDILVLGKGLTSGYLPLSAIVVSQSIVDAVALGSGVTMIGTTYFNHAAACACGVATLQYLRSNNLYRRVTETSASFYESLSKLLDIPFVKAIHGRGFLFGVQFHNPVTGKAFPADWRVHKQVGQALLDRGGIVTYSKGQTVDGLEDYIILSPSLEVNIEVLDIHINLMSRILREVWSEIEGRGS